VTELAVVLVNHDGADCLPAALRALAANTSAEDVECVVVDSASSDGSWEGVGQHWPSARALRFQENIGFCRGCNEGAKAVGAPLVAFVNFDGEVEPGWDEALRELLADPGVSVATGLLLDASGDTIEAAGLEIAPNMATFGRDEGLPRAEAPTAPLDVTAASGALMMVRRDEFLALGGFYEPIWMYGEEADLAMRVPGRVVLHPGSAIRHGHGAAAGPPRSRTRLYWGSRNRLLNAGRHLPMVALARAVLSSAAFDAVTLAQVRSRKAARAMAAGWGDGLRLLRSERRLRTREEKRHAATRLVSLRAALAQQRRLGRL
jgi:N-acetylglucosaminyl-diphospho-decaprenol L-rhamnosyltransferase